MTESTKGSTSRITFFELCDSTTGLPKTGILYTDVTGSYARAGAARTAITPVTQTASGAWSSGGFVEIDGTNQPGVYRFDVPDAAFATGVEEMVVTVKATGCKTVSKGFVLTSWNKQVASIPAVAVGAAGSIVTTGTGANQLSVAAGLVTVGTNADKTGYTASTVSDKTGYSLSVTPPTSAAILTALFTELLSTSNFNTASSFGKLIKDNLNAPVATGNASAATAATQATNAAADAAYIKAGMIAARMDGAIVDDVTNSATVFTVSGLRAQPNTTMMVGFLGVDGKLTARVPISSVIANGGDWKITTTSGSLTTEPAAGIAVEVF